MKQFLLFFTLTTLSISINAQVQWTGAGANTNWNTIENWNTSLVPTAADDVVIPTGFTVTLNVAGSVKSIDVQGNAIFEMNTSLTFTEPSFFAVNTTVNWSSGTLNGTTSTLTNNGTINTITTALHIISGGTTLDNQGTLVLTSSGDLWINGSVLNNSLDGTIDIQEDSANMTWSGTAGVVNNVGLIKKTTSAGEAQIIIPINNNDGTIQVEVGTLSFQNALGKNLTDGTYNVFADATMDWDTTINPSGSLEGTIAGNLNWNNILNIPIGETAAFNFSAAENFNWTSGTLSGGGTLTNTNVLKLTTTSLHIISGGTTLDNQGTLVLTSSGDLWINGSVLNNPLGSTIDIQADSANMTWSGTAGVINNVGLIKKTTSTGEAQIIIPINNNDGTIQVEVGTLSFQNALGKNLTDGTYNVFAGATMDWDTTINPSGSLEGAISGNLNWNGIVNVVDGTSAAFNFSAAENFNWTSGTLSGGGTLTNTNVLKLTTTSLHIISGDTTLDNQGTLVLTSSGDLWITGSGSALNNPLGSTIDIQADSANMTWSGTAGVVNNAGLIKKTTSAGEAQIIIPINNNDGTIQVEMGTLSFQNALGKNLIDGTYNVFAGATMDWDTTINPSGSLEGTIVGNLNWNGIVNVVDGTFAAFNFSAADNFNWTLGTLSGGGTLTNTNVLKLTTTSLHLISGDTTLDNQGILVLTSSGDLWISGSGSALNNSVGGIIDMQADSGSITWSGTAGVINNAGLLKRTTTTGLAQIFVELNNSGIIQVETGELEIANSQPFTNEATGIIKGIGVFDLPPVANYTNNGIFAPGLSPGTLSVQGDYESTASSVLDIELNGLTADTEHDVLAITGTNVIFEGSVGITMGFEADEGNTFTIATVSGTIATKNLVTPIIVDYDGKRYTFDVTYPNDKEVLLTISDKLDIQVPNVITQNITVQLDASGNVNVTSTQIDNGSTDNCTLTPNLVYGLDTTSFTCANLGDNTVMLTVTDEASNSTSLPATVTVEDSINPTVVTQNITVQLDASGNASIVVGDIDDGSSDNCTVTSMSLDITNFTCADLGTQTVNLTVTDESSNSTSLNATVTVEDTVNPTSVTQNITVQLDASGNASITTGDIDDGSSDNCSIDGLSLDITAFTCVDLGANTVSLTVVDQSNNSATTNATVTVVDSIDPVVVCLADTTVDSDGSLSLPDYYILDDVTVTDNCEITSVVQSPVAGTILDHGTHTISYIATDTSGNTHDCSFELTVNDTTLSIETYEITDTTILMYPNPATNKITLKNTSSLQLTNAIILDVTGSVIKKINLENMASTKEISLNGYASGTYFIRIIAVNNSIIKRLIKQ